MVEQSSNRLIIASNRLPFQLSKHEGKTQIRESDGGLVSALKSYLDNEQNRQAAIGQTVWIGSAEFSEKRWQSLDKSSLKALSYVVEPIFLEKHTYSKYYNGFCNATLWPLFHYFPSFVEFHKETFDAYEEVNRQFAERIIPILQPGDILWIHDYQLMLLPALIRRQRPDATIGFFLHIPFPSFEIFRLLHRPWKEKLIDGLLGADLIGFHTHEYVQHFLKTVQMVKGYDHHFRNIPMADRLVKAEMFPLGIDFYKFHNAATHEAVIERKLEIRSNFQGKKIIFSVDRLDYTKGITHRLAGFERFLECNPEWREQIVFILVVVPSRQIVSKYNERKKLIEEEIGRINGKYSTIGWQPILYRYSHLAFHDLAALYDVSDIGLITPLRDGMNLVAKEYVASRSDGGVLILSELAGAANELGEAIQVNPWDKDEMSDAILQAVLMDPVVQRHKINVLQKRLKDYTVNHWMEDFMRQLSETKAYQLTQQTRHLHERAARELTERYRAASRRLILLDYDGTLVPFAKDPSTAAPDGELMRLLARLSADTYNDLTVISGRDSRSLNTWFGALPINLISEHGAGIRMRTQEWQYGQESDQSWKAFIKPTLEAFARRSPGSFVEEKRHTLVWHYRSVNSELGFIRSREMIDVLHHLTRNTNLNVIDGNKVIEVRMSGIDKGVVTKRMIEQCDYDFVLAIGDDKTDEDMFRALADKAYTIKIGTGHSAAKYYLGNQHEAVSLLNQLAAAHEA